MSQNCNLCPILVIQQVIQEHNVEQEIIQAEDDFKIIEHADIAMDDNLVCEPVVEEVVETVAITLATADGQIVRVISKEQYERYINHLSLANLKLKISGCSRRRASRRHTAATLATKLSRVR